MIIKTIRVGIISTKCKYYSKGSFQKDYWQIKTGFSIIHFNARSKNIEKIICILESLNHTFNIIAISETWLYGDKVQDVNIPGYEVTHQLRLNKRGGCCSIFVKGEFKFKVLTDIYISIDNIVECCAIEIVSKEGRNAIISCIYRTPDSNMSDFKKLLKIA